MNKQSNCVELRYNSFATAIADINSGTIENAVSDNEAASVKVCTDSIGQKIVILLSDNSVETQINILRDIHLVLNGKTLALNTPDACLYFGIETVCSIDGNVAGSSITKNCDGTSATMVICCGKKLSVHGGTLGMTGNFSEYGLVFKVDAGTLDLYECVATSENTNNVNGAARVIYSQESTEVNVYASILTTVSEKRGYTMYVQGNLSVNRSNVVTRLLTNEVTNTSSCGIMVGDTSSVEITKSNITSHSSTAWINGINNRGSINLCKTTVAVESVDGYARCIVNSGAMNIEDTTTTAFSQNAYASGIENTNSITANRIAVNSNSAGTETASDGIRNTGTLFIANSKVLADAPGDNANEENATGIFNGGTAVIIHTDVTGTLSGVQNNGKVYAEGGIFTGFSHGGFYFCQGADGIAYVNDAVLRCGHYEGVHTEIFSGNTVEPYGSFYVGGGQGVENVEAYLDGCTIEGPSYYAFIIRSTDGEKNNTVNMSNCEVLGNRVARIDTVATDENGESYATNNWLNIGIQTNLTAEKINNPDNATFTGEQYRKSRAYFMTQVS